MVKSDSRSVLFRQRAIVALMEHPDTADAARALGVSAKTLSRRMKEPAFDADFRAVQRAGVRQQRLRLARGLEVAVRSAASIIVIGKNPAARLQAARIIDTIVRAADEIEDFGAEVAQLQRDSQAREGNRATGESGQPLPAEQGARLSPKKELAITELLRQRSIAEAASAAATSTGTLYRWLQEPAFVAAHLAAASAFFGPAVRLARRAYGAAVTLTLNFPRDPEVPEATRAKAIRYTAEEALRVQTEHQQACLAELEHANGCGEPAAISGRVGSSLQQRLVRLKDSLLQTGRQSGIRLIFSHAVDGKQTGTSVIGADGRLVWHHPPEGCEKDAPVDNSEVSVPDLAA